MFPACTAFSSGLRRANSSSGSLSSRYVSTFSQPGTGGVGGGEAGSFGGGVVPSLLPRHPSLQGGVDGAGDRPVPKVALFTPMQPAGSSTSAVEGGSLRRPSSDTASSRPLSTEPQLAARQHVLDGAPHGVAAAVPAASSSSSAMYSQPGPSGGAVHRDAASGAPPGPVFTSPVRARDAAAGIVLLDDDDATAGNGGAGSARKARSRTRDAGGDAAAAAGTASSWETHSVHGPAGGAGERQQPRLLQFGGPEPHEAGRDSMVATSSSQYDAASGGGYLGDELSQGRIDDGDDPSGGEGGTMRAVPQPGGEASLYAGDSAADSTAGVAAYTWPEGVGESGAGGEQEGTVEVSPYGRWGPAPEGWDQAAFDQACDAAYAQGWVLNERGEWVAAEWVTAAAAAGEATSGGEQEVVGAPLEEAAHQGGPEPAAQSEPAGEEGYPGGLSEAAAAPVDFGAGEPAPGDEHLVATLRGEVTAAWEAHSQAQAAADAANVTCDSLRADILALNAETAHLAALVDTLTGERDAWMERATAAEAANQAAREAAYEEGRAAAGAEADESVSDLLILLGQESRRVEALREALEEVGVDSRAVLAQLQKQEDDEMLASMTGGAGGAAGEQPPSQGGGGDSAQGVATAVQPAAAMGGQHQVWQPAPAATPFGAQQDEDDELALVASLPAPGRGLPAPPPVVVRQQIAVAAHIV